MGSERTSGEVAEKLPGKFGELPGKSVDFPEARRGGLTPSQRLAKFDYRINSSRIFALGNLQKCVGGFLLYKFWRILPGIFLEDFSGHFFPQK